MSKQTTSQRMWEIVGNNPNMAVPWYLILCHLYYELEVSVVPDEEFDRLSKFLLKNWSTIKHVHKDCISKGDLKAGTGYAIKYPSIVRGAAYQVRRIDKEKSK